MPGSGLTIRSGEIRSLPLRSLFSLSLSLHLIWSKQLYRLFWDWVIYSMELLEVYYTSLVIGGVDAEGLKVTFKFTTSMIDDILEDVPVIDTNRYT